MGVEKWVLAQTYAQAIGPGYEVLRAFIIIVCIAAIGLMTVRLYRFYYFVDKNVRKMLNHPMYLMIVLALLFNIFFLIESIDLFAFSGMYSADFYVVMDEICASLAFTNGVLTVNLYHRLVNARQDRHRKLALRVRNFTIFIVWLNFVGFIILGVADSDRYYLYEGLKTVCGALIFILFLISSTYYVLHLRRILMQGLSLSANPKKTEAQLEQVKAKHIRFSITVTVAAFALFVNGVVALNEPDYRWILRIETLMDPAQVALRLVFVLYIALQVYLFHVPRIESSSTQQSETIKNPNNNNNHNNVDEQQNNDSPMAADNPLFNNQQHLPVAVASFAVSDSQGADNPMHVPAAVVSFAVTDSQGTDIY